VGRLAGAAQGGADALLALAEVACSVPQPAAPSSARGQLQRDLLQRDPQVHCHHARDTAGADPTCRWIHSSHGLERMQFTGPSQPVQRCRPPSTSRTPAPASQVRAGARAAATAARSAACACDAHRRARARPASRAAPGPCGPGPQRAPGPAAPGPPRASAAARAPARPALLARGAAPPPAQPSAGARTRPDDARVQRERRGAPGALAGCRLADPVGLRERAAESAAAAGARRGRAARAGRRARGRRGGRGRGRARAPPGPPRARGPGLRRRPGRAREDGRAAARAAARPAAAARRGPQRHDARGAAGGRGARGRARAGALSKHPRVRNACEPAPPALSVRRAALPPWPCRAQGRSAGACAAARGGAELEARAAGSCAPPPRRPARGLRTSRRAGPPAGRAACLPRLPARRWARGRAARRRRSRRAGLPLAGVGRTSACLARSCYGERALPASAGGRLAA